MALKVERFPTNPIITPDLDERIGTNINGPSLIRAPGWVTEPLGTYYLYFAHHKGKYIRMAYADRLEGPWTTYGPGVLHLDDSFFDNSRTLHHVASPDVHVDEERREVRMYYHGVVPGGQKSRVALSRDGIGFKAQEELLGNSYFRVFRYGGYHYALGIAGPLLQVQGRAEGLQGRAAAIQRGYAPQRPEAGGGHAEGLLLQRRGLPGAHPDG